MRKYLTFDPTKGYPAAANIFYECLSCGGVVPSMPDDSLCCSCRNVCIDIDAGRVSVKDDAKLKIFTK